MVPVCFFKKLSGDEFLSPFKWPNDFVWPNWVWAWSPTSNYPPRLATFDKNYVYSWFWGGEVTKSGTGGRNGRWEFGFINSSFGRWVVFLWDDVVDRLLHGVFNNYFYFLYLQLHSYELSIEYILSFVLFIKKHNYFYSRNYIFLILQSSKETFPEKLM